VSGDPICGSRLVSPGVSSDTLGNLFVDARDVAFRPAAAASPSISGPTSRRSSIHATFGSESSVARHSASGLRELAVPP